MKINMLLVVMLAFVGSNSALAAGPALTCTVIETSYSLEVLSNQEIAIPVNSFGKYSAEAQVGGVNTPARHLSLYGESKTKFVSMSLKTDLTDGDVEKISNDGYLNQGKSVRLSVSHFTAPTQSQPIPDGASLTITCK